jgi:glycosyltransferase involved in cell wall biosynthesis
MPISKPLISIIIVNYDGLELLKKCLMSLSKIQFTNYEIILVDNNSSDNSVN